MKSKHILTTSFLALALAGSAHAAGIWSTLTWTDDSSLSFITTTNVTHSADFVQPAGAAATVNGFTFETISIVASFGTFPTSYSGSNFTVGTPSGTFTYEGSAGVAGTASGNLSTGLIGFDNSVPSGGVVTYTLNGLTANTNYEFYFFSPELFGAANRTGSLNGSDDGAGNSYAITQDTVGGDQIIKYAYNTGASTSFTMTVTSDTVNTSIHNFAFVNVIPEPSSAILGGLGLLFLLRRKR
ncbi:MAG: hypothetical protein RLZZ505_1358 [Verrucomicrobiota bacterium]|jgi:hypothetical protein